MNIKTEQRSEDWIAFLGDNRGVWEAGATEVEAAGKLALRLSQAPYNLSALIAQAVFTPTLAPEYLVPLPSVPSFRYVTAENRKDFFEVSAVYEYYRQVEPFLYQYRFIGVRVTQGWAKPKANWDCDCQRDDAAEVILRCRRCGGKIPA